MSITGREQPLDEEALRAALAGLEGWERDGATIVKRFRFKGFRAAIAFVDRVAEVVNRANHHPDIHIEHYKHVRIVLTTHATKSISQADIDVARDIEAVAADAPRALPR